MAFYQSKRRAFGFEPNTTMNVTALVDVLLVTLIIFMLVSPTLEHGIDVQLPVAKPYKMVATKPVLVSLSKAGRAVLRTTGRSPRRSCGPASPRPPARTPRRRWCCAATPASRTAS